eukprot:s8751_g4.t1
MWPDDCFVVEDELERRRDTMRKRRDKGGKNEGKGKDKEKDKDAGDDPDTAQLDLKDKTKWQSLHMTMAESRYLADLLLINDNGCRDNDMNE